MATELPFLSIKPGVGKTTIEAAASASVTTGKRVRSSYLNQSFTNQSVERQGSCAGQAKLMGRKEPPPMGRRWPTCPAPAQRGARRRPRRQAWALGAAANTHIGDNRRPRAVGCSGGQQPEWRRAAERPRPRSRSQKQGRGCGGRLHSARAFPSFLFPYYCFCLSTTLLLS